MEWSGIVRFNQPQPVLIKRRQRSPIAIQMIENPEFHLPDRHAFNGMTVHPPLPGVQNMQPPGSTMPSSRSTILPTKFNSANVHP
jgi:hypothetical protein